MKNLLTFSISLLLGLNACNAQNNSDFNKIDVVQQGNSQTLVAVDDIFNEGWSELAQPQFWKEIMLLSADSCIINIAESRKIIAKESLTHWNKKTNSQKSSYRDSIRKAHQLKPDARIFVTSGKNNFYKFDLVYPTLSQGVAAFEKNGVDPWYAQAILLIESPGQLKKSRTGAYGPFQLMPGVARAQGLKVNKYVDERKDFDKSAFGSSQLIKKICIPEAKKILDERNITYKETDLWFRLFVLHVYHAGAGNVKAVINVIKPKKGDIELIKSMWQNKAASFGNNSQNYSQIALASQIILNEIIHEQCDYIHPCGNTIN